jgi:hypothetical protein
MRSSHHYINLRREKQEIKGGGRREERGER